MTNKVFQGAVGLMIAVGLAASATAQEVREGNPPLGGAQAPGSMARQGAQLRPDTCHGTPEYPADAKAKNGSGTVMLSLLVRADGKVIDSKIAQSSGSDALDQAAAKAISQCRFTPSQVNGSAATAWTEFAYSWKIEEAH